MPAAIAIPLITAGVGAGGAVAGAAISAHQSGNAAKLASAANNNALDYTRTKDAQDRADAITAERANYAQTVRNANILAPAQAARIGAATKLAHLLGVEPAEIPPMPAPPVYTNTSMASLTGAAPTTASMVSMRAPDGSVKAIPADQVGHYKARGAMVVQ